MLEDHGGKRSQVWQEQEVGLGKKEQVVAHQETSEGCDHNPLVLRTPLTRTVVVGNRAGLHLRKCLAVVDTVGKHQAQVTIRKNDQSERATSVLGLLALAAAQGTELVLSATGPEAQQALEAVAMLCTGDEVAYAT